MPSQQVDQAAFTPSRPSSSPHETIYLGIKDRIPITLENYKRRQPSKKGNLSAAILKA